MNHTHICLNEDNGHFYANRTQDQMTETEVRALVDQYADMGVDSIFFCTNVRRALFDSKSWEPVYHRYDPEKGLEQPALQGMKKNEKKLTLGDQNLQLMHNLWLLKQRKIDHHKIWLDQCRYRGIEGWLTVRMNDVHYSNNLDHFWHSTLWKSRPDLWRIQHKFESCWDRAFDYAKKEVRDHHFALIRELLERYDPDGLELDWIRSVLYFAPGMEEEGCQILTQFVRDVKKLVDKWSKKRGHKIKLSVRIPESQETGMRLGMDATTWIKEELVDQIVLSQWLYVVNFDSPVKTWKAIIADRNIDIALNVSASFRPFTSSWTRDADCEVNEEIIRGAVASAIHNGVDRIYFFNYCYKSTTDPKFLKNVFSDIKSTNALEEKSRRHFISPYEINAPGEPEHSVLPISFSDNHNSLSKMGRSITLYPNIGKITPKLLKKHVYAIIGFDSDLEKPDSQENIVVRVNNQPCTIAEKFQLPKPITKIADPVYVFAIPLETIHSGRNAVEINCLNEVDGTIVWLEIFIKGVSNEK